MSEGIDKGEAVRLLRGLEAGGLAAADARIIAEILDPVLVHFIVKYLRESYPASNPAATAVLDRVVELTSTYPAIVEKSKEGEQDPVSVWFEDEYSFGEFRGRGRELIEMIVDKLES
jgi:hypothetical protein